MTSRRAGSSLILLLVFFSHSDALGQRRGRGAADAQCQVVTPLTAVAGLFEGSGLALSRQPPRRFFTLNDSAAPEIIVLDANGAPKGKVAVRGAIVTDWEDVTSGTCADGSCLYVADIGDNARARPNVSVYRMAEPKDGEQQVSAMRFSAVYPDGPHDAEAMFTGADGRLFVITKEARGAGLYRFPARLVSETANRLERIATLDFGTGRGRFARITDAETSPDGRIVAVRTNDMLFLVPTSALVAGRLSEAASYGLRSLQEPQGEGVALGSSGDVYLVGEGGGRRGAGTFAAVKCALP